MTAHRSNLARPHGVSAAEWLAPAPVVEEAGPDAEILAAVGLNPDGTPPADAGDTTVPPAAG